MFTVAALLVTLFGTVTRGPVTPVCRSDSPCDAPAAAVTLTFTHGRVSVRAHTDGAGHYRVRLAAGTYLVRTNAGMRIAPATLAVHGTTMRRDFAIDTGIR
jgi:hypothetical protein